MTLSYRRLIATAALTSVLLLGGCTEETPAPDSTETKTTVEVSDEPSPQAEPKKQKPRKKPYKRPTQELQGKDPFKK